MSDRENLQWETIVQESAAAFNYPSTPDLAGQVADRLADLPDRGRTNGSRQLVWTVVLVLLILLLGTLASPTVRATIRDFLQIGAVLIELERSPQDIKNLQSISDLDGETDLAIARNRLSVPIRLPTYPADLGEPDRVFVQQVGGTGHFAHLIWLDHNSGGQVRLSLMTLEPDAFVTKAEPKALVNTTVHGSAAIWTNGPYALLHRSGGTEVTRLINGHVLIWTEIVDGQTVTLRLETDEPLQQAIRIAESLE